MPPQRRQSHAPTTNGSGSRQVLGRKRAQSLLPSEVNRHLVPRKSILKSAQFTFNSNPSQQNENDPPPPAGNPGDDATDNNGMNYTAEISDNTTRKSLARRVSFAPLASFRVFETNDNTNSTNGPSSSPTPPSPAESELSPLSGPPLPPIRLSNENDYPGRRSNTGPLKRVSVISDYGERSMSVDMDQDSDDISEPPTDPVFFTDAVNGGSDYGPPSTDFEDGTEEEEDDEDMEITEAIALSIDRKRSLSIAQQHELARRSSLSSLAFRRPSSARPSSVVRGRPENGEVERNDAEEDVTTNTQASEESDAPKEGTIALGQPLRKPRPPSDAWFALKALVNGTSDGDEENEDNEEEMELTSALSRLQNARSSLGLHSQNDNDVDTTGIDDGLLQDDSFANSESSMDDSVDLGDRTLNVTALMGRVSDLEISGGDSGKDASRTSDEDPARPIPLENTAPLNIQRKENATGQAVPSKARTSGVFSTLAGKPSTGTPTSSETDRSAPQRSHSPGVTKGPDPSRPPLALKSSLSTSIFSAPPVTPSRIPVYTSPTRSKGSASVSPSKKRLAVGHDVTDDAGQPSPAKKRIVENSSVVKGAALHPTLGLGAEESGVPHSTIFSAPRESLGGIRRPSGYFSQRRSLTPGAENEPHASRSPSPAANGLHESKLSNGLGSEQPDHSHMPIPARSQAHDENVMLSTDRAPSLEPLKDKTPTSILTAPTVIVTAEDAPERAIQHEAMDVETEKRGSGVLRRSLVSYEMPPPDEEYDDIPSMSIQEFFLMTGIKFHDYTIPRRSTIHPSQLQGDRRDSSLPPSMANYLTAMVVHVPQLELYRLITKDLQMFIDNSVKNYREAEEEVAKLTPVLFREFAQSGEEGREELMHQLKLIKANRLIAAKERWYDVRGRWVHGLLENADRAFAGLEKDRDTLTSIIDQAQALLPALKLQRAQAQAQLERERIDVEEFENSDPAYLEELKVTIEEQNQILEVYKTDVTEGTAKIDRLEGKLAELEAQRLENVEAIEAAERRIVLNKTSTRAEVFRLKDKLECLQALHSWRASRVSKQLIELVFNEQFLVSVPCTKFRPTTPGITIRRTERPHESKRPKEIDLLPIFSDFAIHQAESFAQTLSTVSIKTVLEALSDFWSSCTQIRTQLTFLGIKYPLKLELIQANDSPMYLRAIVTILLPKHTTKLLVAFVFSPEVLANWPFAIRRLQCEAKAAYGGIDPNEVRDAIMERLLESTAEDNHACILDSCVEAASRYE